MYCLASKQAQAVSYLGEIFWEKLQKPVGKHYIGKKL